MKAHLSRILVLKKDKNIDFIDLKEGLNLVVGSSQTGKSALLEIIDYCILSSNDTIPKGVITDNAKLYCISVELDNTKLILARKAFLDTGKTMAFFKEVPKNFSDDSINFEFFEKNNKNFKQITELKKILLRKFSVGASTIIYNENDEMKERTPTIRNYASFMFQHQNLITNKFALFYRFDDFNKRKKIIEEFPIFTGLVNASYYTYYKKKEELKKELKKINLEIKRENKIIEEDKKIYSNMRKEFAIDLGVEESKLDMKLADLGNLIKDVDSLLEKEVHLNNQLKACQDHIVSLQRSITSCNENLKDNEEILAKVEQVSKFEFNNVNECPFCHSEVKEFNEEIDDLRNSKFELENTLNPRKGIPSLIANKKLELNIELEELKNQEKKIKQNLRSNKKLIESNPNLEYQQLLIRRKLEIDTKKEKIGNNGLANCIEEKKNIEDEIDKIKSIIGGYDLKTKLSQAQAVIASNMNRIAEKLNFEEGLGKPDLVFDLETFDLYQRKNNEKIYLSSMGSGSNWLTCHLALFLAFQNYFASLKKECSIPNILFLDQPSQVYFPNELDLVNGEKKKSEDIKNVEDIYSTILSELNLIEKDFKITPQVIVVDHADNLDLGKNVNFESLVRARWKKENNGGFIKA